MKKKLMMLSIVATASAFSFTTQAKQFNYCLSASPDTLNPYQADSEINSVPIWQMYEMLLYFNYRTNKVEPMLVEKWNISNDGLVYTLHLRKNVQFQSNKNFKPTRPFNAEDVVFSLDSQLNASSKYMIPGNDVWESVVSWDKYIKSVKAVDNYTVEITLNQPKSTFLTELTMFQGVIKSKEYADAMLANGTLIEMEKQPIGTGAYQIADYRQGDYIHFTAFKNYWGTAPSVDRVNLVVVKDPNIAVEKIEKEECDATTAISGQTVINVRKAQSEGQAKNIFLSAKPITTIIGISMNYKKGILQNLKIRQAISHAINYDKIINDAYKGLGVRAVSAVASSIPGFSKSMKPIPYDLAKAKQLVKESGVDVSKDTLKFYISATRPESRAMGEIVQSNLKDIGIKVEVVQADYSYVKKLAKNGEVDLYDDGWSADIFDASNFLRFTCESLVTGSPSQYCSKEFDDLGVKAMLETDNAKRNVYFAKQQELLSKTDLIYIPLVEPKRFKMANADRFDKEILNNMASMPLLREYKMK